MAVSNPADELAAKYRGIPSKFKVLDSEKSLSPILESVQGNRRVIVGFDFDQTITHVKQTSAFKRESTLRGGEETKLALQKLKQSGVPFCIITAQDTSIEVVKLMRSNLAKLGLAELFEVDDWDRTKVGEFLRQWGPNTSLPLERLTAKLATLLIMNTPRYPADLARIGFSPTKITATSISFRLQQTKPGPGYASWSALQTVSSNSDPLLCPVACWQEYLLRTGSYRANAIPSGEVPSATPAEELTDRLFVRESSPPSASNPPLSEEELLQIVSAVLKAAGLSDRHHSSALSEPAKELHIDGGIKIARLGNVISSKYNKPQALQYFLNTSEAEGKFAGLAAGADEPTRVVFVDDNSDNVFNVFVHFAKAFEGTKSSVHSYWYPCPADGRDELHNETYRTALVKLAADDAFMLSQPIEA